MTDIKGPNAFDAQNPKNDAASDDLMRLAVANQALRQRAEQLAHERSNRLKKSMSELSAESAGLVSADSMRQKMYELQVHQIELQLQNEELQRAQLELDSARARYFDLYDLAPVGYCTLNESGDIIEANLTAATLIGVARSTLVNRPFTRFICPSDQDNFYLQCLLLREHFKALSFDMQMQKADGTTFWVLIAAAMEHKHEHEHAKQMRIVLSDISERREAKQSMLEYQARYRNLFVGLDVGLCVIEVIFDAAQKATDYRFIEVNPAFEKHSGLVGAQGKLMSELALPIEEYWLKVYGDVVLSGSSVSIEHESKSLGRWFDVHASPHGAPTNNNVAIIFSDVTERKNMEARSARLDRDLKARNIALEQAIALAEKASAMAANASQAKSAFLSSMSHELRTPLHAILGFAQMLEIGTPPPTPQQKRNVDQILKAGWYLLELINEVLDLSMIESGKVVLSSEPVALSDLLLECRAMIEQQAQLRGIILKFPSVDRAHFVSADRTRLKQVLLNLLLNAIKYNRPNGSVTIEFESITSNTVRIGVRDTGLGMAPEQMSHLFQPFNRLGRESSTEEGTGIGLVVTKRLIELMAGRIGVESAVDVGSFFWVELQVSSAPQVESARAHVSTVVATEPTSCAAQLKLLYVEDNPANLELVEQLVSMRTDLHLLSATNASTGIEFARTLQPDVILMDINLPGMSGIQALHILRNDPSTRHIPVIALSANAMANDVEQGLQLGFFHYLTKPIRVRKFMQSLDDALAFAARTKSGAYIGARSLAQDNCHQQGNLDHLDAAAACTAAGIPRDNSDKEPT